MEEIIFDFFNDNHEIWLSHFCKYFYLNKGEVVKYFNSINPDRLTPNQIIEDLGINLSLHDSSKVKITCRHMTTTTVKGLKSFKEKGLMDLKRILELDTPLSEFLSQHKIWVDVNDRLIKINDEVYPILVYGDVCEECFIKNNTKCSKNSKCDLRKKLECLGSKLYKYGATIECFIYADIEQMERYSTIDRYPEILYTLDDICFKIPNDNSTVYNLCRDWMEEQKKCYVIEYESNLSDMETYAPSNYDDGFGEYDKCIINSGYSYNDYLEGEVKQQVFDNMIFIKWFISIYFYDSEELGSLLPNKCVPSEKIRIMEIKDRKLKYIDY